MIRALDLIAAVLGGLLALPIVLTAALLVRLDSPGPALFRQQRVGRAEQTFLCYKLRTMSLGTAEVGTHQASATSVTAVGRWLRRTKLDELPQLWNVLRGEMSLVGPRPCLRSQVQLVEERRVRGVYAVRPGITGRAQLIGLDMSTPLELAIEDAHWSRQPNLKDYLLLIILTVVGKGQGDAIRG
ncbi:MAG: sugar transferase [Alphaproteobacteria bacterium]|nr:sugar transferase [Rhizobiaceae bacterium]MBU4137063.1 sugar transferase [Alphaproteobacteria bacterium]